MTRLLPAPIFKPHLLAAAYAGRKTQTRRIVSEDNSTVLGYSRSSLWGHLLWDRSPAVDPGPDPFGSPGYEYLHVDAWNPEDGPLPPEGTRLLSYRVRPRVQPGDFWYFREGLSESGGGTIYTHAIAGEATNRDRRVMLDRGNGLAQVQWRWKRGTLPSIHMPRECARRFARVESVRVEPVQDIKVADAIAEGIDPQLANQKVGAHRYAAVDVFSNLWNSINAKRGFGWDKNPWVWVYTFALVERAEVEHLLEDGSL